MFVGGRLSVRIVFPFAKLAAAPPLLARWIFHVHGIPAVPIPLTLLVFTAVRSGAPTVTVSLHVLLPSLLSGTTFPGSAAHTPPVGFTKLPIAVGVARKLTVNDPAAAIDTAPLAEHVSVLLVIAQLIVPVIPTWFAVRAEP